MKKQEREGRDSGCNLEVSTTPTTTPTTSSTTSGRSLRFFPFSRLFLSLQESERVDSNVQRTLAPPSRLVLLPTFWITPSPWQTLVLQGELSLRWTENGASALWASGGTSVAAVIGGRGEGGGHVELDLPSPSSFHRSPRSDQRSQISDLFLGQTND